MTVFGGRMGERKPCERIKLSHSTSVCSRVC